jgi:hypothetical protein
MSGIPREVLLHKFYGVAFASQNTYSRYVCKDSEGNSHQRVLCVMSADRGDSALYRSCQLYDGVQFIYIPGPVHMYKDLCDSSAPSNNPYDENTDSQP